MVPRDDPCMFCSCGGSEVQCIAQACALALPGPHCRILERKKDQCCPQFECDDIGKGPVEPFNRMPYLI